MNWTEFKDPLYYRFLAGTMVVSWSLSHEVASLNNLLKIQYFSLNSAKLVKTFRENSLYF